MKLYFTETSPYSRKVRVVAEELGLASKMTTEFCRPFPNKAHPELSRHNPLSKIPALVLEDGTTLYDSPVIVEYLDSIHAGKKLVAPSGANRFRALRLQALCDGILDAAILVFYEHQFRPKEMQWDAWLAGQTEKATQGLDEIERECESFGAEIDLPQICAAVTVGWLEFRNAIGEIRANQPKLFAWYERFRQRQSMLATEYKA